MMRLADLLALDDVARASGCGLNPRLRAAIEAQCRFPSRAAGPDRAAPTRDEDLPANVTRLAVPGQPCRERSA